MRHFSLRLDEMSIFLLQVAKVRLHDFDRCKFHVMLLFGMHLHFMQCHFQIDNELKAVTVAWALGIKVFQNA